MCLMFHAPMSITLFCFLSNPPFKKGGFLADLQGELQCYVTEELNVQKLETCSDPIKFATLRAEPNFALLGKRLGKEIGEVAKAVKKMSQEDLLCFQRSGSVVLHGHTLSSDDISIKHEFRIPDGYAKNDIDAASGDEGAMVILELTVDQKLLDSGAARELINRLQKLRKSVGLQASDNIFIFFEAKAGAEAHSNEALIRMLKTDETYLKAALGCELRHASMMPTHAVRLASEACTLSNGASIMVTLTLPCVFLNERALLLACENSKDLSAAVSAVMISQDFTAMRADTQKHNGTITINVDGRTVTLHEGEEFMLP